MWIRLVLVLAPLALICAAVLTLLYRRADATAKATLEIEAGKTMLYVIAAVLISAVVQAIVRNFEDRRKAWIARRDLMRTDLTDGVLNLYSRAKGIRRRLRANVQVGKGRIDAKTYGQLLEELSDTQLGLERYKRAAEGGVLRNMLPQSVGENLAVMEKYLGDLVTEYESARRHEEINIRIANLPKLVDFVDRSHGSAFHTRFVAPYYRAAKAIDEVMAEDLPGRRH
jgi:hypothetical protein